jgi:hypothetical protein
MRKFTERMIQAVIPLVVLPLIFFISDYVVHLNVHSAVQGLKYALPIFLFTCLLVVINLKVGQLLFQSVP